MENIRTILNTLGVTLEHVKMVIFWKSMGEVDLYTAGYVRTFRGDNPEVLVDLLLMQNVAVEIME